MTETGSWSTTAERLAVNVLDGLGRASARIEHRALGLQRFDDWNDTLDLAARAMPSPDGCRHDVYLELVRPTDTPKQHLLVTADNEPLAVISVRRRGRGWEPVTYQCLPGVIALARSVPDLGRALRRTGLDIGIEAGLNADMSALDATLFYPYDVRQIDLTGDYASYWRSKGLHKNTKRAAKRCAEMEVRINADGGITRTVEQWRSAWAGDERDEVGAATDRERFWKALAAEQGADGQHQVLSIELVDGDRPVAGTVSLLAGDRMLLQCFSRDPEYDWHMAGTRVIEATIDWAVANGSTLVDFGGGGGYKRWWAPVTTTRHGAIFRPRISEAAHAAGRLSRTTLRKIADRRERTDPTEPAG